MAMGLSMKLGLVSATVLSTAVIFNLLAPVFMDFAISDLPTIWTSLNSWLKPPYLYVVINCIIITIVASSRLQYRPDDSDHSPPSLVAAAVLLPTEPLKVVLPAEAVPHMHEPQVSYDGVVLRTEAAEELSPVQFSDAGYNGEKIVQVSDPDLSTAEFIDEARDSDTKTVTEAYEEIMKKSGNKSVISMSSWTPSKTNQVDLRSPMEKPAASARFSHRKPVKASPEGGRTLGVSKPKRQDTLETTWKTITEGRSIPLTRHLRKSDTWETHGQGRRNCNSDEFIDHHSQRMKKSDTFDVNGKPPAPASMLRKEPSLGQEELNKKVEAFIKKFNEDMRLQRQESLNQYMEMINRGGN